MTSGTLVDALLGTATTMPASTPVSDRTSMGYYPDGSPGPGGQPPDRRGEHVLAAIDARFDK